ncbi:MAG: hypothetical protein K6B71_03075 [Alphaproteobacteria bacterium]|nr:hypothetical protein [Alphaproteobacteria bacterium]
MMVSCKQTMKCWTNKLDTYKNTREKSSAWVDAVYKGVLAVDEKGNRFPVKNYDMSELAFVAGVWRVQRDFPYEIINVRNIDMVLLNKIDRKESTLFEFWNAKHVEYNCYGPFVSTGKSHEYVVAKYATATRTYWGYGKNLEEARAYLGLKLYDEYKDVIHVIANGGCAKK